MSWPISLAPVSIFAVVLAVLIRILNPLLEKYLDPHIVTWSGRLLAQPGQLPKRIARLLQRIGAPTARLVYLFVVIWIVARLTIPSVEPPSSPEVIRQQLSMTTWVALYNVASGNADTLAWPAKGSKIEAVLTAIDVSATQGFLAWARSARKDEYNRVTTGTLGELKVFGLVRNIRVGQNGMPSAELTHLGKKVIEPYL